MTSASVQAAVYVREKQKLRQNKRNFNRGRFDLPSHVATRDIAPFPTYPPQKWGKSSTVWLEREKKSEFSPCIEIPPSFIGHGKLKFSESQRKWAKRNKMQESSFGGSSSEDIRGGLHRQYDAAANMLLYIGLCAVALGLVIAFVGTGEKGFKTVQLRLIGPMMIGCGTFCCFLRILFCFCPTKCMRKRFKHRHKHMTEGLSDAAAFNRHAFETDDKFNMEYYKHLPFHQQMGNNFLLLKQNPPILSTNKKRVSIETQKNDYMIDDVPSDSLSTLRQLSPLHEEDLIDFQQSSNSFENIPSLDSSLEFLGGQLKDDFVETKDTYSFPTKEQLQGLMSTLTFRDSMDQFADSRLTISYDDFDLHDDLKFNESNAKSKNDIRDKNEEERSGETNANQELVLSAGNLGKETLNP
ncbi:hypothetical protein PGB90_006414 [Kerria lacca]